MDSYKRGIQGPQYDKREYKESPNSEREFRIFQKASEGVMGLVENRKA